MSNWDGGDWFIFFMGLSFVCLVAGMMIALAIWGPH